MSDIVTIKVHGLDEKVPARSTVAFLIKHFEEKDVHLLVELNGRCIYPTEYTTTEVCHGDILEFINPNLGG